ncbi:hypothetical protein [Massilia sp. CF038]|uniref:hypothetical protein n=1 Tax=Massilia sp. CF038 TaxID=1881045 RepID=UPI000919A7BA|nr:hypothetical protein [Massilia sp. CF038]SHH20889.1 hypothetical protein SAMN05428948_3321 [Massilia sp. CF038]
MRPFSFVCGLAALALAGCASAPPDPPVSLINSLSFDNPMSGKRDGLRSAWPVHSLTGSSEHFPLAQLRQCDAAGNCSWGVLRAQRSFGTVRAVDGGVSLELDLMVDVDRSQHAATPQQNGSMTIPANVGALQARQHVQRALFLPYGKVETITLDFGVRFDLCAFRLDAARQPTDQCDLPYF